MIEETPVVKKEGTPTPGKKFLILLALGGLLGAFVLILYEACVQVGIAKY